MRNPTLVLAVVLVHVSAAACARQAAVESEPSPAASAAVDPTGMYDFTASMRGQTRTGTLEIERTASGGLAGEAWLEGESDPALIQSGSVRGNSVVLHALIGGGNAVTFELDLAGASFTGVVRAGDETIGLTGTRRAP